MPMELLLMPVYQCGSARVSPPRVALCLPTSHRRRAPRSPSSSSFFLLSRLRSHTDTSAESAQDEAPDSKDDPSGAPESQTNPPFVCTPVPHTEDTSFPPSSRGRPIKHPAIRPRRARSAHQAVPHARGTKDVQPEAFLQLASVPFLSLSLSLHLSLSPSLSSPHSPFPPENNLLGFFSPARATLPPYPFGGPFTQCGTPRQQTTLCNVV